MSPRGHKEREAIFLAIFKKTLAIEIDWEGVAELLDVQTGDDALKIFNEVLLSHGYRFEDGAFKKVGIDIPKPTNPQAVERREISRFSSSPSSDSGVLVNTFTTQSDWPGAETPSDTAEPDHEPVVRESNEEDDGYVTDGVFRMSP